MYTYTVSDSSKFTRFNPFTLSLHTFDDSYSKVEYYINNIVSIQHLRVHEIFVLMTDGLYLNKDFFEPNIKRLSYRAMIMLLCYITQITTQLLAILHHYVILDFERRK